jgi:hypothetical protein
MQLVARLLRQPAHELLPMPLPSCVAAGQCDAVILNGKAQLAAGASKPTRIWPARSAWKGMLDGVAHPRIDNGPTAQPLIIAATEAKLLATLRARSRNIDACAPRDTASCSTAKALCAHCAMISMPRRRAGDARRSYAGPTAGRCPWIRSARRRVRQSRSRTRPPARPRARYLLSAACQRASGPNGSKKIERTWGLIGDARVPHHRVAASDRAGP